MYAYSVNTTKTANVVPKDRAHTSKNRQGKAKADASKGNRVEAQDRKSASVRTHGGKPALVSACLLGEPCRYDGNSNPSQAVCALASSHILVPACPEQLGGLPTPRVPSEIQPDGRVVDKHGADRTSAFASGAQQAVEIARTHKCTWAILKANSPSCGVHAVYDGSFEGILVPGQGIAAAALRAAGLELFDEADIREELL